MAKAKKNSSLLFLKQNLLPVVLSLLLLILMVFTYQLFMADKYYPVTLVGDINISFLTRGQAIKAVDAVFQNRSGQDLPFDSARLRRGFAQGSFTVSLATSSASLDYAALDETFNSQHRGSVVFFLSAKINPKITFGSLDKQLISLASAVDQTPQNARLIFNEIPKESTSSSNIQIVEGIPGLALDKDHLYAIITDYLLSGRYQPTLPLKTVQPNITTQHVTTAKEVLDNLITGPIKLVFERQNFFLDAKQLLALLDLETGRSLLDQKKTYIYLSSIASEIDQNVQEGLFTFNPVTKKVTAFQPSREGRKLDVDVTYKLLTDALASQVFDLFESLRAPQSLERPEGSDRRGDAWERIITLPVEIIKPKIQTQDINSLGIKELLGRGVSNFAGSISNRIYNISLTAAKINGILVPPGQVFSFNKTVGDISAATGFKQAYVIKEGRTVLDDGGGVCQDSTTLFRAVLNAGLPVIQRTAHAYRVGYYEQGFPPGLDATVFAPSVDFQFKNDTPGHILIQAYISGNTLYVDLYGTSDNRTASLTKPIVTNQIPPPPDLRQDDLTLPKGTVKQVDWSAWGATVVFNRTVIRNGETIVNETWKSVYRPWQAVFLVGTGG